MKKILIVTVTAGEGHNSIAKALRQELSLNAENEVKVIDLFKEYSNRAKFSIINDGYIWSCRLLPSLFNSIYTILQKADPEKRDRSPAQITVKNETPGMLKTIYDFQPDVILMTHMFPSVIITNLRKAYDIPAACVSILTDYTVHPFWEAAIGIDYLITPCADFDEELMRKGYKPAQLLPLGLPVKKEFSEVFDKSAAREKLGLDKNLFTVMIMNGGAFGGLHKMLRKVLEVKTPLQLLAVNGKDEKSKETVQALIEKQKTPHKIVNYGFIDFVSLAMSASDCILGKCGCITTNEALNKEVPMVITSELPQQEIANMEYLISRGAAIRLDEDHGITETLSYLANHPEAVKLLQENIRKIRKPTALKDIISFVESQGNVRYSNPEIFTVKKSVVLKNIRKKKLILKKEQKHLKKIKNL